MHISADREFLRFMEHLKAVRRLEVRSTMEDFATGSTLMGLAAELRGRANALVTEGANLQMLELIEDDGGESEGGPPSPPCRARTPR